MDVKRRPGGIIQLQRWGSTNTQQSTKNVDVVRKAVILPVLRSQGMGGWERDASDQKNSHVATLRPHQNQIASSEHPSQEIHVGTLTNLALNRW